MVSRVTAPASTAAAFLAASATRCEAALHRALPGESVPPARLHRAMRYAVFAGGKRLRPALVEAAALACSSASSADARVDAAMAAVELLHTYTLVHDDLPAMDDDDLRRGRPTCHKAFDEATAILAGDALQCAAFATLVPLGVEAVRCLAAAAGSQGVVGGQQDDLDAEGRPVTASVADQQLLERIHLGKTAALIRASCELGCLAVDGDHATRRALAAYGEAIGLAFQIADDVLDATATAAALGKTPGKDAAQGKLTYVAVFGLDRARAEADRRLAEALAAIVGLGERAAALRDLAVFVVQRDR